VAMQASSKKCEQYGVSLSGWQVMWEKITAAGMNSSAAPRTCLREAQQHMLRSKRVIECNQQRSLSSPYRILDSVLA